MGLKDSNGTDMGHLNHMAIQRNSISVPLSLIINLINKFIFIERRIALLLYTEVLFSGNHDGTTGQKHGFHPKTDS
jgi:hypothetical protein